jgi:predicted lipoprotein with Yx(FWY)xxD motif
VVDASERTLYHLTGESTHHVRCTGSCLRSWLPLTVTSPSTKLIEGQAVSGQLEIFRRPDGTLQVTLRGFLLYRFAGDRVAGQTLGNGIYRSGGAWALVLARAPKLQPIVPPTGVPGPKLPPIPPPA